MSLTASDIRLAQVELWNAGDLSWLLDANQLSIKEEIEKHKNKYFVVECARRVGKSFLMCVMAVEKALRQKRANILYAAPTTKDAQELLAPLLEQILETAPFRAKFDRKQSKFVFPNGSQIRLFGCDNKQKANRGRGTGAHLVILDEAGFIPTLDYVLHSIVAPQTLTTRGRILLASTPSDEPDHPFTHLAERAEGGGYYVRRTIYENPRLSNEERDQYVADDAALLGFTVEEFKQSDVYKREFLALRAIDTNLVVCPDWKGRLEDVERPKFFDGYVALDIGGVDPHGILFGYWDYEKQQLVIEDELLLRDNENTEVIAARVKEVEARLWGTTKWDGTLRAAQEARGYSPITAGALVNTTQPYLRVCDSGGPKLELKVDGVCFLPTEKTNKWEQVNTVNVLFRQDKIKISPRCRNLARHVKTTMWLSETTKTYRRRNGEHGDLLDCLVYMVRNLRRTKDPRPLNWGVSYENTFQWPKPPESELDILPSWRKLV